MGIVHECPRINPEPWKRSRKIPQARSRWITSDSIGTDGLSRHRGMSDKEAKPSKKSMVARRENLA
jgi:hypothetical protein